MRSMKEFLNPRPAAPHRYHSPGPGKYRYSLRTLLILLAAVPIGVWLVTSYVASGIQHVNSTWEYARERELERKSPPKPLWKRDTTWGQPLRPLEGFVRDYPLPPPEEAP